ncbi:hypothetical protein [Bacteroides helcogenes]|uniref:Lipoprotein n=1 Tax=Bacteroides helcogenes (strain ATCC 35417 / DSM 20613 / JCM 6297 / CCUG 15421 / P 36-108) TaxID=693979 RepID=E6SS91_BACT6|nr:hypothetical protein [Bacteroides helcogenes]ADV44159.1 hypothetical protein Bache_2190 [Bacteroides helcogenes P 36-108]MDY5238428.1 hypothetical protein [Bacteroides helcogenes]
MHTKKERKNWWVILLLSILFSSCSNINFELPQGPQGVNGKSAYEIWKEEVEAGRVNWPSDKTNLTDFLVYIKGEKGDKGTDGLSAYDQWKALIAQGNVANPHDLSQIWPSSKNTETDFWDFLSGRDGQTPHIGENGNWYIGNKDTGIKAIGKDGKDGINGKDGLSAYDLWKHAVINGSINWPKNQTTMEHFFLYFKGKDGENGITPHVGENGHWYIGNHDTGISAQGKQGNNGKDGTSPYIGPNGNWWVNNSDTKVKAQGEKGSDGLTPLIKDGYWWIGNSNTGIAAQGPKGEQGEKGADGLTPVIKDGNWWIGNTDTGIKAQGTKGDNGISPQIGTNGNWWIGNKDTGIKARGENGVNGASAYELWVNDVKNDKIKDKNNASWPKDKITMADFYTYLSGTNGSNGKSAYELWKETVIAGNVDDPKNPGQKWPSDKVAEKDFFDYLAGKDGINGTNGLSAYELWKNDLAKRCGTSNALTDHRNGGVWNCDKNTLDDFYNYLRGKDGKDGEDGKDGKPGEPGKPGTEVTIIKGVPNVIVQYSQSEYGEYVRTSDGGVLYKVYDETGQIAPKAQVKGMPGISAEKVYIADDKGEFIVPKEDLPEIQDVNLRWGTVKEVTIAGKAPQQSAKNTYVPNKVRMRMILRDNSNSLYEYQYLYFYIQRKVNPEDEWQNIPSYLPNSGSRNLDAYRVSDKNIPNSILSDKKLYSSQSTSSSNGGYYYYIYTYRFIQENPGKFKNNQSEYWDGTDVYYTVKAREPYYGENFQWNGVCLLAPLQMGPTLKKLKLKTISNSEAPNFSSAEGELDFSKIDFTKIYKSSTTRTVKENGIDHVEPIAYTEEEAKKLKMAYITFEFTSTAGSQKASSSNNSSSAEVPTFKVFAPFLNSSIYINNNSSSYFYRYYQGYLKKGKDDKTFIIENYNNSYELPEVEVTYEE